MKDFFFLLLHPIISTPQLLRWQKDERESVAVT
jgi:hypothetical protein